MRNELVGTAGSYLLFELGAADEQETGLFAVEVPEALQVIEPDSIASVPLAPDFVHGIMNHHGRIITIADPAPILGLSRQPLPVAQVVILRQRRRGPASLGLQVLRIRGILPGSSLQEVDVPTGPCVRWVGQTGRQLTHVLELDSLLERLSHAFGPAEAEPGQGVGL